MARSFLRGIAVVAGTGLGAGAELAFGRRPVKRRAQRPLPEQFLFEPIMERLDRMEARIALAESRPGLHQTAEPSAESRAETAALRASLARIEDRLAAQSREIELLRIRADEAETIAAAEIRLTERRFKEAAEALPAEIEALVSPRVEDLRQRLHLEMKQSVTTALTEFEQSIDTRISSRMSAVEHQLLDLSGSLADLKKQAGQTDINLQKLIQAVERLCDRQDTNLMPAPEPAFFDLPFEKHLKEALEETPATVVTLSEAALSARP